MRHCDKDEAYSETHCTPKGVRRSAWLPGLFDGSLVFSPNRYWPCAATTSCIKIWDLESKIIVDELLPEFAVVSKSGQVPYCTCLCWSFDGATLFSGYTDGAIRAWHIGGTA